MRPREPRLRDETGAEIDMTTGERCAITAAYEFVERRVLADLDVAVAPLSGGPKCARYPALPCPHDCEFGIFGPCVIDAEDA